jgi:hypothetical protein
MNYLPVNTDQISPPLMKVHERIYIVTYKSVT